MINQTVPVQQQDPQNRRTTGPLEVRTTRSRQQQHITNRKLRSTNTANRFATSYEPNPVYKKPAWTKKPAHFESKCKVNKVC